MGPKTNQAKVLSMALKAAGDLAPVYLIQLQPHALLAVLQICLTCLTVSDYI